MQHHFLKLKNNISASLRARIILEIQKIMQHNFLQVLNNLRQARIVQLHFNLKLNYFCELASKKFSFNLKFSSTILRACIILLFSNAHARACACTHVSTHVYAHMCKHMCMHTSVHTCVQAHICTLACLCACTTHIYAR